MTQGDQCNSADWRLFLSVATIWGALPFSLFPIAERYISSAVTGLLNGGTPSFAAVFATVLLSRLTRGAQLLGIAVGFVGVALVGLPTPGITPGVRPQA